jgi:hypothetical protein
MSVRFQKAILLIDAANTQDPNVESVGGEPVARELLYSQRMTQTLARFVPEASETLALAVRAQHIRRWDIPRAQYAMDRSGYKEWRTALAAHHGNVTAKILSEADYENEFIERVRSLIQKQKFKTDPEAQVLEDVACLVFLQFYLEPFAEKQGETKTVDILRKTWVKMSDAGHREAQKLQLPPHLALLVKKVVGS